MKYLIGFLIMLLFTTHVFANGPTIVDSIEDAIIEAQQTHQKIAVVFGAKWCGACKKFASDFDKNPKILDDYIYVYVDIDQRQDLKKEYRVRLIPDFMILENSREIKRRTGYINAKDLKEWLAN